MISSRFLWGCVCAVTLITVVPYVARGFQIVDLSDGSTLASGETFRIQVDPSPMAGIAEVRYYWYGEREDMLKVDPKDRLALVATKSDTPRFGGEIKVPTTAIGNTRLLAEARFEGAMAEQNLAVFDEVIVNVEPEAQLEAIEFETEKPLRLGRAGGTAAYAHVDFLGKIFDLPVVGVFADGVSRPIRMESTGTTFSSSDEDVVKMHPNGLLEITGNGQTTVTATNRGVSGTLLVEVDVNNEPNQPPVPKPGPDQTVRGGARVSLNALNSYDPEGGSLEYHWSQIRGSKVPLLDPNTSKPSFSAPLVPERRLFRFMLVVTDINGADSMPVFVDVTVEP